MKALKMLITACVLLTLALSVQAQNTSRADFATILNPNVLTHVEYTCVGPDGQNLQDWGAAPVPYTAGTYGNIGSNDFCLVWQVGCTDNDGNNWASVDLYFPGGANQVIEIRHLDGLSNLDSIQVWSNDVNVANYTDIGDSAEKWVTTQIPTDLGPGNYTIKLVATDNAWSGCDRWGQVAIDYIEVKNLPDDVPEFGVLASTIVLGLAGLYIYKRRR